MKKIVLSIGGMSCSACSSSLENFLNKQDGIISVSVNLVLANASIEYDDNLTKEDLDELIKKAGFKSLGEYKVVQENLRKKDKLKLILFGILALIVLYVSMSHMVCLPTIEFLNMERYPLNYAVCLAVLNIPFLIYGLDILISGVKNLLHRSSNMDTLVMLGVLSSELYSLFSLVMIFKGSMECVENLYFESVCIIIYFVKLGRFIADKNKNKTLDAIKELVTITPDYAYLKKGDEEVRVTLDKIKVGDILICKPGMKIAVDGKIVKGSTHLDEAFITGESIVQKKSVGDDVLAGSLNVDGFIEYEAIRIGAASTISEVVRLVIDASNTKTHISSLVDKISRVFVPTIFLIALLTFIAYIVIGSTLTQALERFITILVSACPCALGLATPLAIVVSEGVCARFGILVKSSDILERVKDVSNVVFDKTGTLTYGDLRLSEEHIFGGDSKDVKRIVASLESKTSHPISNAFKIDDKLYDVVDFKTIDGIGLTGKVNDKVYFIGNNKLFKMLDIENDYEDYEKNIVETGASIVYVFEENKVVAIFGVKDIIRDNIEDVIKNLKAVNKKVVMLTGDNERTAKIIALSIGIDEVRANVLPKEKKTNIDELKQSGKVMMIGDGINDAPSLKSADIGVSVASGTDIANNSSDIILMNNDLSNIVKLFRISKFTFKIIGENLFWAFIYNIGMIIISIGILPITNNPMIAAFAMTLSSITVSFNSLRILKLNKEGR